MYQHNRILIIFAIQNHFLNEFLVFTRIQWYLWHELQLWSWQLILIDQYQLNIFLQELLIRLKIYFFYLLLASMLLFYRIFLMNRFNEELYNSRLSIRFGKRQLKAIQGFLQPIYLLNGYLSFPFLIYILIKSFLMLFSYDLRHF